MGVSAAAANAFIKQHNVIYFNSHLGFGFLFFFFHAIFIWNEFLLLFILEGELKKVSYWREREWRTWRLSRSFPPKMRFKAKQNQAERQGVTQKHLLLRLVGGGARSTTCGHSLQRPSPIPGLTGKWRVRAWDGTFTLSSARLCYYFLVYLFLLSSHSETAGAEKAVSFQYNWT